MRFLLVGLLAFVLVTQAAAAAMQAPSEPMRKAKAANTALTVEQQLERKLTALRRYRGTLRFFDTHRHLLSSTEHRASAVSSRAYAQQKVRQLETSVAALRRKVQI